MTKKLNESGMINELTGQSAFFPHASKQETTTEQPGEINKTVRITERNSDRKSERSEERTENRSVGLPVRREAKRYSFEIYIDQIKKLKHLKNQAEEAGQTLTLSAMAREALDQFLKDK